MSEKQLVVFGDSVTWGQGHVEQNKFSRLVADSLSLEVRMFAHSGATIGVGDSQTGGCGPEAPTQYPTVLQQLEAAGDDPTAAAVVLVDGGINDISVQTIVNPLTSDKHLKNVVRRYCHDDMLHLLYRILDRFKSDETPIVVTSYFPIFSHKSEFDGVLHYLQDSRSPHQSRSARKLSAKPLPSAPSTWLYCSGTSRRTHLKAAVREVGSDRARFADVPFQEENAMFAKDAWLFNVHVESSPFRLVPEDDVINERHRQCIACHPGDPLGIGTCDIASAGHPNVKGARQFADTILEILSSR